MRSRTFGVGPGRLAYLQLSRKYSVSPQPKVRYMEAQGDIAHGGKPREITEPPHNGYNTVRIRLQTRLAQHMAR